MLILIAILILNTYNRKRGQKKLNHRIEKDNKLKVVRHKKKFIMYYGQTTCNTIRQFLETIIIAVKPYALQF